MGLLKNILPNKIYSILFNFYQDYIGISQKSYSGEAEDLILRKIFSKNDGFYIDIGCYHPKTYSNTYFFYQKGWKGLNIDANPTTIQKFKKFRKRDINLNVGMGNENAVMKFYLCDAPAMNTFSEEVLKERMEKNLVKLVGEKQIQVRKLAEVLDEYLPKNQRIDFMDIDVEGFDLEVLQSNNWEKYRPTIILVEEFERNLESIQSESKIFQFLENQNYTMIAKTFSTFIFSDKNQ